MSMKSGDIERWRTFFRGADGDIFDVLEYAILVAASDYPKYFMKRRDFIAQKLFACPSMRCIECESVALTEKIAGSGSTEVCQAKETKINSITDDNGGNSICNANYDEAENLMVKIEDESRIIDEVVKMKVVLESRDQSDTSLLESLKRLQTMELSVDILKVTQIGKSVSMLKKHTTKEIKNSARTLIRFWKKMVDDWIQATSNVTGDLLQSVNPSTVDDEEGLLCPPMDEEAFLAPTSISMELPQFFERVDDGENPHNGGNRDILKENGRRSGAEHNIQKQKVNGGEVNDIKENAAVTEFDGLTKKEVPLEVNRQRKFILKLKPRQRPETLQKITSATLSGKSECLDDQSMRAKLEATKRKLHEQYQQAENAKKQRTIQVMELHDLPKEGFRQRHSNVTSVPQNRHWNKNGRR